VTKCIFSGLTTPSETLCDQFFDLAPSIKPFSMRIDCEKFLDLFGDRLGRCDLRSLCRLNRHVENFKSLTDQVLQVFADVPEHLQPQAAFNCLDVVKNYMNDCEKEFLAQNDLEYAISVDNDGAKAMSHSIAFRAKLRPHLIRIYKTAYEYQKQLLVQAPSSETDAQLPFTAADLERNWDFVARDIPFLQEDHQRDWRECFDLLLEQLAWECEE